MSYTKAEEGALRNVAALLATQMGGPGRQSGKNIARAWGGGNPCRVKA